MYKSSVLLILGFILLIRILFAASAQNPQSPPAAGTFVVGDFVAEDYIRSTGAPVTTMTGHAGLGYRPKVGE